MAQEWVSPHDQNFVISPEEPRTQYVGDDPALGVVYLNGMPKDRARSNFNFLTTGCHACTNGRFQDEENAAACRGCPDGTYNIDNRNPWRIPPASDALGNLPQNRWKLDEPVFQYEWWRIKGYPKKASQMNEWHEVDEGMSWSLALLRRPNWPLEVRFPALVEASLEPRLGRRQTGSDNLRKVPRQLGEHTTEHRQLLDWGRSLRLPCSACEIHWREPQLFGVSTGL